MKASTNEAEPNPTNLTNNSCPPARQKSKQQQRKDTAGKRKSTAAVPAAQQSKKKTKKQHLTAAHSTHAAAAQAQQQESPPVSHTVATAAAAAQTSAQDDEVKRLFRSWAWKREHRPDKDRFHRPYVHTMSVADSSGQAQQVSLTIKQQKFSSEGFASTVWDSSIVAAKYLEKLGPDALRGRRCLDLSAGCGLAGVVMAKLGAVVTVTDLASNLPLLQHNCKTNGVPVTVLGHRWGEDATPLHPPFDFIVACDVMYVHELVQPLLQSLLALSGSSSTVLVAHGRNRPAEPDFKAAAAAHFSVELVPSHELDDVYQCSDVDVLRLKRLTV